MKDHEFLSLLDERMTEIARSVCHELSVARNSSGEAVHDASLELRQRLAVIKAKEHVTVREAALLLSCSESHIRKLVRIARKNKTLRPIPFVDMEGVTVFPRSALQEWASPRPQLHILKNEAA